MTPLAGPPDLVHTAVAALAGHDLLVFTLTRTAPADTKPDAPARMAVIRVTPDLKKPREQPVEEFEVDFREPFQAYVLGDEYYFLTRSGSVYRAPPADKGKSRRMVAVWAAPQPPVGYIFSDGNRPGVHYLVVTRKREVEQTEWYEYFRLGPNPQTRELKNVEIDSTETPVERAYWMARALRENEILVTPK
ncbi:hypothetical protein [Fimbriiglobus ruber]|uniref:hypothetical protein n=1 Tax=Fimbriiglobus ruber TaxID=1908690 RepID=UPI00117BABCD|nr:hypothetical protein [Fimbriiglobus ruber]